MGDVHRWASNRKEAPRHKRDQRLPGDMIWDHLEGLVFVSTLLIGLSTGLSRTNELQNLDCLPVFTHNPSSLTKCYCTSRCPSLEALRNSCQSGQLQIDPCGICLQCAPGYGEKCGGFGNADGVCSGGLGCLVRYQPGRETEHNKTGTCVTEQGKECSNPKSGVSCRPGQIGVPSDFVFCSNCGKSSSTMSNRNSGRPLTHVQQPNINSGFLFAGGEGEGRQVQQTEGLGTILNGGGVPLAAAGPGGSIVSSIFQEIQASLPASIGDSIRENIG